MTMFACYYVTYIMTIDKNCCYTSANPSLVFYSVLSLLLQQLLKMKILWSRIPFCNNAGKNSLIDGST